MKSSVAKGTVTAPPSKSFTHRAMVLGALTHSHFALRNPLMSDDTVATLDALHALGAEIRSTSTGMRITCEELRPAYSVIDSKNSGTTLRLMSGIASLLPSTTTLTGDESLLRRPMGPLVDALSQLGATCAYLGKEGKPPVAITGPITNTIAELPGGVSSQFVSSLLIACSQKKNDTRLWIKGELRSRPYVDITIKMLREFGAELDAGADEFVIKGEQPLTRDSYDVPGDYSSASFPLAAGLITHGEVTVRNLDKESPQGDRAIVSHLESFGAEVTVKGDSIKVSSSGTLTGTQIDVRHTPDLFPVLAVIGATAKGETVLTGGENLREKESDRIATTTRFLREMGADIKPTDDGCRIVGVQRLHGAAIETDGDHRIMMSAVVAGLSASSETSIQDADSFKVSYPGFLRDLHQLGCRVAVRK